MWLMTTKGFFSAVAHPDDPYVLIVRSRKRDDLQRLVEGTHFEGEILETPQRDYPYRIMMHRETWAQALAEMAREEITYPNFKDAVKVATEHGAERAAIYGRVWGTLIAIEREGRPAEDTWSQEVLGDDSGDWLDVQVGDIECADCGRAIDPDDDDCDLWSNVCGTCVRSTTT